ncbi:MAG: helix-turn-helix domain-containing protein [Pseudomonadota bacterium]|nr:helix-turn-helix domain-containing protein [Pseudomonadota bacterium]
MTTELTPIRRGSGNVFADLGFPDAASHLLKASLVVRIQDAIDQRGYSQAEAGRIIGISQPDISRMLSGHFRDVSVERLMRFLQALGYEIDIVLREAGNPENGQTIHLQPQTA